MAAQYPRKAALGVPLVATTATFGCSAYAKPLSCRSSVRENLRNPAPIGHPFELGWVLALGAEIAIFWANRMSY